MTTTHSSARRAVLAAVAIAVTATACSRGDDTPQPAPTTAAPVPPTVIVAIPNLPDDITEPTGEPTPDDTTDDNGSIDVRKTGNETLDDLFWQDDPTGTAPQIALRFVRALQRRDYLTAARQLDGGGRLALSGDTMGHLRRAGSSGRCNELVEFLGGCHPSEGLARAAVEAVGGGLQGLGVVHGQVGALGEVLAEQAVGVLVGAALPG